MLNPKKSKKKSIKIYNLRDFIKNNKIIILIFFVGIIVIVVSLYNLLRVCIDYKESDDLYQSASQNFTTVKPPTVYIPLDTSTVSDDNSPQLTTSENETEDVIVEQSWYDILEVDFEGLQEVNPEVSGWIFFENEEISYPVLYSGDNEKYLKKGYNGKTTAAGSIFIDGRNNPDLSDAYTLIYGHNMQNLSMFVAFA